MRHVIGQWWMFLHKFLKNVKGEIVIKLVGLTKKMNYSLPAEVIKNLLQRGDGRVRQIFQQDSQSRHRVEILRLGGAPADGDLMAKETSVMGPVPLSAVLWSGSTKNTDVSIGPLARPRALLSC